MQDTVHNSTHQTPRPALRRQAGPVGGVSAGIARTLGLKRNVVRIGIGASAFLLGPIVLFAYLAAWFLMPVDEWLPESEHPRSAPKTLLMVVGAVLAAQVIFGLITNLPFMWLMVGGIAAWWIMTRD